MQNGAIIQYFKSLTLGSTNRCSHLFLKLLACRTKTARDRRGHGRGIWLLFNVGAAARPSSCQ